MVYRIIRYFLLHLSYFYCTTIDKPCNKKGVEHIHLISLTVDPIISILSTFNKCYVHYVIASAMISDGIMSKEIIGAQTEKHKMLSFISGNMFVVKEIICLHTQFSKECSCQIYIPICMIFFVFALIMSVKLYSQKYFCFSSNLYSIINDVSYRY